MGGKVFISFFNLVRLYFLFLTLLNVSNEGIEVDSKIGIFSIDALEIAISLALYLIPSSCLYEESCSSSTTINPKFLNGKNNDDLAPTTNLISPLIIFFQIIRLFF